MNEINKLNLEDELIKCVDCDQDFTFTVGEHKYFISRDLSPPKRCPKCREKRRKRIVPEGD